MSHFLNQDDKVHNVFFTTKYMENMVQKQKKKKHWLLRLLIACIGATSTKYNSFMNPQ